MTSPSFDRAASSKLASVAIDAADHATTPRGKTPDSDMIRPHFHKIVDDASIMMWASDPPGNYVFVSPSWCDFTGQTQEQAAGQGWADAIDPIERDRVLNAMQSAMAECKSIRVQYRLRRRDGVHRWVVDTATPRFDASGAFIGYMGSVLDVTDRMNAEESLRALMRISKLLNSTLDVEELLDRLVKEAIRLVQAEGGLAGLKTEEGMVSRKYVRANEDVALDCCWGANEGLPGWLLVHKRAYITNDAANDEHARDFSKRFGVNSALCVPILGSSRELLGFFEIHNKRDPAGFGEPDREKLSAVAEAASIAVRNALIFRLVRETECELRESESRLRIASDAGGFGVYEWQVGSDTALWENQRMYDIFGLSEDEPAVNKSDFLRNYIHPDDKKVLEDALAKGMSTDGRFHAAFRMQRRDGAQRCVESVGKFEFDAAGQPTRLVGVMADITDRRNAEEALRKSEAFVRSLMENSPDCVKILDLDGRIEWMNPGGLALIGVASLDAIKGKQYMDFWGEPTVRERAQRALEDGRSGRAGRFDGPRELIQGVPKWWDVVVGAIPGSAQEPARLLVVSRDVTEFRRINEAMRENEEKFQALADNISQLAWMADEKGLVFWYNKRWFEYTGTTLEEMAGWGWKSVHHPDHVDRVVKRIQWSWDTGELWEDLFPLRSKAGEYRWFLSRAVPIRDEAGKVVRWCGTNTDITEQQNLEEALREADRRKDEFLATLAHELRNPLAPMSTALRIAMSPSASPEASREALSLMDGQLQQMVRLVDDLLDIARITKGKIQIRREACALQTILSRSVAACRPLLEEAGVQIRVNLPAQPIRLNADPARLSQVFSNLLNNAAKYSLPGGQVSVEAACEGRMAAISIKDTGVGIAPDMLERIFEMFAQVDSSPCGREGGMGIGLWLVRSLVELHEGRVEARSNGVGKGSEFVVRLPMIVEAPAPASGAAGRGATNSPPPAGLRVLVVDDSAGITRVTSMFLQMSGCDVRTANNGPEALWIAEEFHPQLVLLDIGMPKMSGHDVARKIREQPWGREAVLIAVTGWGKPEDRAKTKEAGFDQHIVKPFAPEQLHELLASVSKRGIEKKA